MVWYSMHSTQQLTGAPPLLLSLQVFPTAAFQQLYDGLKSTTQAGGPSYHLANYTVITNNHQAIFGGWQVRTRQHVINKRLPHYITP